MGKWEYMKINWNLLNSMEQWKKEQVLKLILSNLKCFESEPIGKITIDTLKLEGLIE